MNETRTTRGNVASYALTKLTKSFQATVAVNDVSIEVRQGEIRGVIGRNGAGKSVLMSVLAGVMPASTGGLEIADRTVDLTSHSPTQARALGIVLIPQEPLFAQDLDVLDNIFMGRWPRRLGAIDRGRARAQLKGMSERLGIRVSPDQSMDELPIEDQQMLALGTALYVDRASVLLLDEITASLSRSKKQVLGQTLVRAISERPEISVTLITHHIDEVVEFCERVTVMRDGRAVDTLDVSTTTKSELANAIVGDQPVSVPSNAGGTTSRRGKGSRSEVSTVLKASEIAVGNAVSGVSFDLKVGEVLGVAGLDGSGKDELLASIAGLATVTQGSLELDGVPLDTASPLAAGRAGVVYLPKKREQFAVLTGLTVQENALALVYGKLRTKFGLISGAGARETAQRTISSLRVKAPDLDMPIESLSGGNRQRVMIGRLLNAGPRVFVLNEPNRGVDMASTPEVLEAIRSRLAREAGVILTSESEEELTEICDRILVIYRGAVVADIPRGDDLFESAEIYRLVQGVQA